MVHAAASYSAPHSASHSTAESLIFNNITIRYQSVIYIARRIEDISAGMHIVAHIPCQGVHLWQWQYTKMDCTCFPLAKGDRSQFKQIQCMGAEFVEVG